MIIKVSKNLFDGGVFGMVWLMFEIERIMVVISGYEMRGVNY